MQTSDTGAREYAVGADIGGTQMRTALVDRGGAIRKRASGPTEPARGIEDATRRLVMLLNEVMAGADRREISAVGVASAGPVDPGTGIYYNPPNLHTWDGRTMLPDLRVALGLPVVLGHDARSAAIAEMRWGAARGMKDVIYVTVSTGIGGGLIVGGRPVVGVKGLAGEMGHIVVDPDGPPCNGGCHGCVEVLASGGGMANAARHRIQAGESTKMLELAGGDASRIVGRTVFEAAAEDDEMALDLIGTGIRALGIVLGGLLNTFSPEVLIVGGSVGKDGYTRYWDRLDAAVRRCSLLRYQQEAPLSVSQLGDDVGLLGAAAIAFDAATGPRAG